MFFYCKRSKNIFLSKKHMIFFGKKQLQRNIYLFIYFNFISARPSSSLGWRETSPLFHRRRASCTPGRLAPGRGSSWGWGESGSGPGREKPRRRTNGSEAWSLLLMRGVVAVADAAASSGGCWVRHRRLAEGRNSTPSPIGGRAAGLAPPRSTGGGSPRSPSMPIYIFQQEQTLFNDLQNWQDNEK